MNHQRIVVFDFETGSRDPFTTQPIELAAVVINPYKLTLVPEASFNSLMRPTDMDALEDDALRVNHKTREQLADAPLAEVVWEQFVTFVRQHNLGGRNDKFAAPIAAGHNIMNFDMIIIDRLCKQYGTVRSDGRQAVFNGMLHYDTLQLSSYWLGHRKDVTSLSMDYLRDYFGISKEGAHNALKDVEDTAAILMRYLQLSQRIGQKVQFKGAFADGKDV